jgi:peptidoglycan/LPS O-acetylase OafA/YrhL
MRKDRLAKLLKLTDTSKIRRISYREDINILRAVAVLSVVFYHAEISLFRGGWLGVDIFFVISGYLISNIIISELNEKQFSFKEFYLRRIRRILPALISTLLMSVPLAYFILSPLALLEYGKSLLSSLFFYSNYYFSTLDFYNSEPSKFFPLLHTWSLSVEEQFYILFPGVLFVIHKFRKNNIFLYVSIIFLSSILFNSLTGSAVKFYLIQYRVWELLLGCIVMIISKNIKLPNLALIGYLLISISLFTFDDSFVNYFEPKFIVNFGASLVLLSPVKKFNINNFIFTKIQKIGIYSYSIYLLHQPIFAFSRVVFKKRQIEEGYLSITILFFLLLLLSHLNYNYVELRFIKNYKVQLTFLLFALPIIIFSIFINNSEGVTSQYEEVYSQIGKYYSEDQRGGVNPELCTFSTQYYCQVGNQNLPSVIVIGDSHLTTLSRFLYNNLDFEQYNLILFIEQGCPFFLTGGKSERGSCATKEKENDIFSLMNPNSTIVYGGRFPRYLNGYDFKTDYGSIEDDIKPNPFLIEDISKSIEYISKNTEVGLVLFPIPELGFYPLEYYLYEFKEVGENLSYNRKYWDQYSSKINEYLENITYPNIKKIESDKIFCDSFIQNMCTASYDNKIFYWDDDHLSYDGTALIGERLLLLLKEN